MAAPLKSGQQIYDDSKNQITSRDPTLTDWNDGSLLDILTGVIATAVQEIQTTAFNEFRKTWTTSANGPDITGGEDELQNLYVDRFGDEFARPGAMQASGEVTFSRENTDAGDVLIQAGTIVKTAPDVSGVVQRFATEVDVKLTGTSINATVKAVVAGAKGNVAASECDLIETNLTDGSVIVTNAAAFSGGSDVYTDSQYREFARNLLVSLRGATLSAIEAKAETVSGVEKAVGKEAIQTVIEYDVATSSVVGDPFKISRNKLYVADANGSASSTLVQSVEDAILGVRASGVQVEVVGASAVNQNITISVVLNADGPNFSSLSSSLQPILDDITIYLQDLDIGADLIRANLKTYILGIWGASGSNDVTDITIVSPVADISVSDTQKLIPGTVEAQ